MDLLCRHCREPWENDTLHDVAQETGRTYREVAADFRQDGCEALGTTHGEGEPSRAADVLYELLGDDMDGAAAMLNDLEYFEGGIF